VVLSISRFLLFANVAHGIQAEPHSPVTNPHVRIGQITPALSPRAWSRFRLNHLDEKWPYMANHDARARLNLLVIME
jgi:hypothetical protein